MSFNQKLIKKKLPMTDGLREKIYDDIRNDDLYSYQVPEENNIHNTTVVFTPVDNFLGNHSKITFIKLTKKVTKR